MLNVKTVPWRATINGMECIIRENEELTRMAKTLQAENTRLVNLRREAEKDLKAADKYAEDAYARVMPLAVRADNAEMKLACARLAVAALEEQVAELGAQVDSLQGALDEAELFILRALAGF